jgi:twitching motility protein PilT
MQAGGRYGMQTMDMSLAAHIKAGRITQQMAYERCHDPEELQRLVGSSGGLSAVAGASAFDSGGANGMGMSGAMGEPYGGSFGGM